jgi:uncharacterized membrane protein (DUF106 family)
MITFNTILAQTLAGTIIEIIVLLLVAGLIGYFTSYFYYRSIYRKKIHELESELRNLQIKNGSLQEQIVKLNKELEEQKKNKNEA